MQLTCVTLLRSFPQLLRRYDVIRTCYTSLLLSSLLLVRVLVSLLLIRIFAHAIRYYSSGRSRHYCFTWRPGAPACLSAYVSCLSPRLFVCGVSMRAWVGVPRIYCRDVSLVHVLSSDTKESLCGLQHQWKLHFEISCALLCLREHVCALLCCCMPQLSITCEQITDLRPGTE